MLTAQREQEVIALCQDLIKVKSLSGQEGEVMKVVQKAFKKLGYDNFYVDTMGNTIGIIKGNLPGPKILIDGHLDTVPVSDPTKWTMDPFGGEIKDGKIYGRGSSDMKGQVASYICAAAYFAEDNKRNFPGEIYVVAGVFEEIFEGIAAGEITKDITPDLVIIAEPSSLNLKIGQKGRAEIVVETFGKAAHASKPSVGVNAVYQMNKIITEIQKIPMPDSQEFGGGVLELTDILSDPYPGSSVVPSYCRTTFDRRFLPGETRESILEPIQEIINSLKEKDPKFDAKVSYEKAEDMCYTGNVIKAERFFPAWNFDQNNPLIQKAYKGLTNAGLTPNISYHYFCTNGSHYGGEKNLLTIGFGPSSETLAHVDDEYIEIDQLNKGMQGFYSILTEVLK